MKNFIQFFKTQVCIDECFLCQHPASIKINICPQCINQFSLNQHACKACAQPLTIEDENVLCGKCQQQSAYFDKVISPFLYQGKMIKLIHQLKFHDKLFLSRSLALLFLQQSKIHEKLANTPPDCILPVPLHITHLKQRGFNQALEISKILAQQLNIKIDTQTIVRIKATESQRKLNAQQRIKNVANAFALKQTPKNKHIALVDDVMTTGSTVNAMAKLLKQAGVDRVDVWTIARA